MKKDTRNGMTMNGYELCTSCARHIRRIETVCPFCGARHSLERGIPHLPLPRMSRARWMLVVSTTGLASCTTMSTPVNEPVPAPDAVSNADDASADASIEAMVGGKDAMLATIDDVNARFETSDDVKLSDDAIADGAGNDAADGNEGLDEAGCPPGTVSQRGICGRKWEGCPADGGSGGGGPLLASVDDAGDCPVGYVPTVPPGSVCQISACSGRTPSCHENDCGVLELRDGVLCCWAPCYGAPPARLDRLV
jgi:hypothetical protein